MSDWNDAVEAAAKTVECFRLYPPDQIAVAIRALKRPPASADEVYRRAMATMFEPTRTP
jgi:hypothetical protein